MATVSSLVFSGTAGHPSRRSTRSVNMYEFTVNIATLLTAKGSALAAADVFQVMTIPAGTIIYSAGLEVTTVGNATAATFDLGYGGSVDVFADGVDIITATGYGANGTNGKTITSAARFTAADTLDIVLATLTGTLSTGKVRVYVVASDVSSNLQTNTNTAGPV